MAPTSKPISELQLEVLNHKTWINFLALLPSTLVTVLAIGIAFLRFYDQSDFEFLGWVTHPRVWSNRFTVAALLAALANFGIEWNNRNREADRLAQEAQRSAQEEQRSAQEERRRAQEAARRVAQEREARDRRAEARERETRRARIEARCRAAQIQFQLNPNETNRRELINNLAVLEEYGDTL